MMIILLKILIGSGLFIGLYHFFLTKEKMFRFNRIYLLLALFIAYVAPFISFRLPFQAVNLSPILEGQLSAIQLTNSSSENTLNSENILWIGYLFITFIVLMNGINAIMKINKIKGKTIVYQGVKIMISDEVKTPFSFWKTIYLTPNHIENNIPDEHIFLHEKHHLLEKHTLDIFFLEILKILTWFNPFLYFYKRAILANHEFLADEYVLQHKENISDYQHLILKEISGTKNINLTHSFKYNNIKKRFIMMTTKQSKFANVKKIFAVATFALFAIGLSQTTYAQTTTSSVKKGESKIVEPVFPGGELELRTKIAEEFDTSVIENEKEMQTTVVFFTIDKNGQLQKVETKGENKAMNAEAKRCLLKAGKGVQWKPAQQNGQNIDYVMKLPISIMPPVPIAPSSLKKIKKVLKLSSSQSHQ